VAKYAIHVIYYLYNKIKSLERDGARPPERIERQIEDGQDGADGCRRRRRRRLTKRWRIRQSVQPTP